MYFRLLDNFKEGVLAGIFDDLDRVQHMFLRTNQEIVDSWYLKLDQFVGEVQDRINKLGLQKYRFLILSDHGFRTFKQKVHINRWLVENGYMNLSRPTETSELSDVDWDKTKAYALGLNSLYLNIASREGKGIVQPEEIENLLDEIKTKLLNWKTVGWQANHQPRFIEA